MKLGIYKFPAQQNKHQRFASADVQVVLAAGSGYRLMQKKFTINIYHTVIGLSRQELF
jgi:hypothetical protein